MSKCKSASNEAAPLETLVKILYNTLFPTEKKRCEIGKISSNVKFLHKETSLFDLPFLDDFSRVAQLYQNILLKMLFS